MLNEPAELALFAGRYEDTVRWYELAFPNLRDPLRPDIDILNFQHALQPAYALDKTGEKARAGVLYGRILDFVEGRARVGMENAGITDGYVYAALGETDKALAAIGEAIDAGWLGLYDTWTGHMSPLLEPLNGNPEFEAMVAEIEADLARQLVNVQELESAAGVSGTARR